MQTRRVLFFHAVFLLAGHLHAQSADQILRQIDGAEAQQRQLERMNQERLQEDRERLQRTPRQSGLPNLSPPDLAAIQDGKASSRCHAVRVLEIRGAHSLPADRFDGVRNQIEGACISVREIESAMAAITAIYFHEGMVMARVYLPAQDLTSEALKLDVLEGVIEKYVVRDGGKDSVKPSLVMPLAEGDVLNLRDLEQGMRQLDRLTSNQAQLDIQPGSEAGRSIVIIENRPGPAVHGSLSYDNHGSRSAGKNSVGLGLTAENVLGLNEYIGVAHRRSLPNGSEDKRYSESNSLSAAFYWGYSTLNASMSASRYVSPLVLSSGSQYKLSGDTTQATGKFSHVVYRSADAWISLDGGLTAKSSRNYFNNELLVLGSRRLTVLDLGISAQTNLWGGTFQVSLETVRGLQWFGALKDDPELVDAAPRAQFRKTMLNGSFYRPFQLGGLNFAANFQLSGQTAHTPLYGSEQMNIGGLGTVRGFSRNSWSGDSGYFVRADLSAYHGLNLFNSRALLRTYVGYDMGRVSRQFEEEHIKSIRGMALGMSLQVGKVNIDIVNTRALKFPLNHAEEGPQTWVRLSMLI